MPKSRKSLVKPRLSAFNNQNGRCYYCNLPMWLISPNELTNKLKLSTAQASLLKCTGEHLIAHMNGGRVTGRNIVAACWYCNIHRHRCKRPAEPELFKIQVRHRVARGRWHGLRITEESS